jgi:hypothetical protein
VPKLFGVAFALASALWLVTGPSPVSACTGCPTTFEEFVDGNDRIVLAGYAGHSGGWFLFHVIDVLQGTSPSTLPFKYNPVAGLPHPVGSRWLISTYAGPKGRLYANVVFQVHPGGSVKDTDEGEGSVDAPDTLAGWYSAIARLPDTATEAPPARPMPSPTTAVLTLAAAATLGGVVMLTRLAHDAAAAT